jgi:KaiC/GvpD/RAD55 family RecA-like ATPase
MDDLVETGVDGLDSILGGGIVPNAAVLVSGNPGTGKSILGMEFVYRGASEFDEDGIYLTFEESADDLRQAAESIGFEEWGDLVDEGRITVFDKRQLLRDSDFSETLDRILDDVQRSESRRLVMDSVTMFGMFFDDEKERRSYLLRFIDILKGNGLTALLTNEQGALFPETEVGLENFLTDGNVYLSQIPTGSGVNRYLWVAKMRKQDVETDVFPMDIETGGIRVHENASGFSMMEDAEFGDGPF